MFPLGSVLLPGDVLPLHVFEQRYRALIRRCLTDPKPEFGVVLIDRGHEVGGGDVRRDVGTVARLIQVAETPDGRFAAIAVGTRRIRVTAWLPEDPYPRAEVEDWPETDDDPAEVTALVEAVEGRVRRLAALAAEVGEPAGSIVDQINPDPLAASHQLVTMAPVGAADRYDLLCCTGPAERVRRLAELLDDVEAVLKFRLGDG